MKLNNKDSNNSLTGAMDLLAWVLDGILCVRYCCAGNLGKAYLNASCFAAEFARFSGRGKVSSCEETTGDILDVRRQIFV